MRKNMTPTMVAKASGCVHSWYLECHGDQDLKVEPDAGTMLMWERGNEHERRMVESLPGYEEPQWDGKDWEAGYKATLQLMKDGVEWIFQGVLVLDDMYGKPDLLKRVEVPSKLGGHSYIPVDVKNHKDVNRKDRMQLASYSWMLEPILGYRPKEGSIWLNTELIDSVELDSPNADFESIRQTMVAIRDKVNESMGFRCSECAQCQWIEYCHDEWESRNCVCLLRGITAKKARKLRANGLFTVKQVADVEEGQLVEECGLSEKVAHDLSLHAKARVLGKPISRMEIVLPEGRPIVFYDIETYGKVVYLHGLICLDDSNREEKSFLARDPGEEREIWHALLDYLSDREGAVIYIWTNYERRHVEALWEKYGGSEKGWKVLDSGMVDMCKLVKDHFALPVTTYSIKEVAPVFGFHWQAEDAGGLNSEAWYGEWLKTGSKEVLEKIKTYNLDDVRAMDVVFENIRTLGK